VRDKIFINIVSGQTWLRKGLMSLKEQGLPCRNKLRTHQNLSQVGVNLLDNEMKNHCSDFSDLRVKSRNLSGKKDGVYRQRK